MSLAIRDLERRAPLSRGEVDAFIATHDVPIVEGPSVTFLYRGEADAVNLRHWIYGLPASQPFTRIPGSDLWYRVIELPHGSRVEYKLEVIRGGDRRWIEDPLNPLRAHDPFGANSVCHADGYEVPAWTRPDPDAPAGRIEPLELPSAALGRRQRVQVYLPARFSPRRRVPLLIIHDGSDYLRYAGLKTVLDNLIHRLEVAPLVVALTDPGERLVEYAGDDAHARHLAEELLPALDARYPLLPQPSRRGLMGASLGAVASLHAAWRHPGRFGRLLLQSGSFAFADIGHPHRGEPVFERVARFVNAFRDAPGRPSDRLFVTCGTYESLIYENRSLVPLLQQTGMEVRFEEARDGHNWENWRDRLRVGLSWLFRGPLWLVYE